MFCANCGAHATGNFCSSCGAKLVAPSAGPVTLRDEDFAAAPPHWEEDCRYDAIMKVAAVRSAITRQATLTKPGISGEAILELYDKVVPSPIPLASLAGIVQPLYGSIGIRTGKERSELVAVPVGAAIARVLCSLSLRGQTFQHAEQRSNGCVITAELPSSVCAFKGTLIVSLATYPKGTRVTAATNIPGQLHDWGKSQRCLDQLFRDLENDFGLVTQTAREAA